MKTRLIYDPLCDDIYELQNCPLLTLCVGRNSHGEWIVKTKEYIDRIERLAMQEAKAFLILNAKSIGIHIKFKTKSK